MAPPGPSLRRAGREARRRAGREAERRRPAATPAATRSSRRPRPAGRRRDATSSTRRTCGSAPIFRQQRIGQYGRLFTLYKLRSLKPAGDEGDVCWNIDHDSRLGPVGRFIRRTSIDELPQLVNVLKGDMSLVGPRPERPYYVAKFSREVPGYADRHRVPVGLTGLAVVKGLRGDTSIAERARVDNSYADDWSLWLDLVVLVRTAIYLVKH
ncbi:sugar transferase [Pseudonocardia thermophila]|uniref:sugar transferase n=1 Tax=Pseudonocardia thermophila TaxID=1848 RepID=UPI00248E186C|nr:sugar transferase [Pseudonocardia thermophila]